MAKDRYSSFVELQDHETLDEDYTLSFRDAGSRVTIIAPHGGKIEPRTSDLVRRIAGEDYNFYCFEGIKEKDNACLHITSHRFDKPAWCSTAGLKSCDMRRVLAMDSARISSTRISIGSELLSCTA